MRMFLNILKCFRWCRRKFIIYIKINEEKYIIEFVFLIVYPQIQILLKLQITLIRRQWSNHTPMNKSRVTGYTQLCYVMLGIPNIEIGDSVCYYLKGRRPKVLVFTKNPSGIFFT